MQELAADYARATGVFDELRAQHLAVQAILEGEVPGARVFVDDAERPQAGLAWNRNRLYLAGTPFELAQTAPSQAGGGLPRHVVVWQPQRVPGLEGASAAGGGAFAVGLRSLFERTIRPERLAAGSSQCVLFYAPWGKPGGWEGCIEAALQGVELVPDMREHYVCHPGQPGELPAPGQGALAEAASAGSDAAQAGLSPDTPARAALPEGFSLRRVDGALLAERGLKNLERLEEELCSERASVEDFLTHSFGVCALHGDEIVAWCLSEYNRDARCEVGIETVPHYRGQGLGTLIAAALLEEARARGVAEVGWDCWARNVPSWATARRAGFSKLRDYPVYVLWLRPPGA